jgi:hypothetical protein
MDGARRLAGEVFAAAGTMAAFAALALAGVAVEVAWSRPYPAAMAEDARSPAQADEPTTWLVDGFNLLHAAVLRGRDRQEWWRAPARERLLALVRGFDDPRAEVVVVFDGRRPAAEPEELEEVQRPRIVFADSADEWMLRAVRLAPVPARIGLVTADRQLADRARHRGVRVVSPTAFARRCAPVGGAAPEG